MTSRRVLALLALCLTTGCISMRGDYDPFRSGSERRLTVIVLNENYSEVTVTAIGSGRRTLMGRAAGNARSSFSIPWEGQSEVRFQLEAFGGGRHTTQPIFLAPGASVELRIRDPLQQSIVRG